MPRTVRFHSGGRGQDWIGLTSKSVSHVNGCNRALTHAHTPLTHSSVGVLTCRQAGLGGSCFHIIQTHVCLLNIPNHYGGDIIWKFLLKTAPLPDGSTDNIYIRLCNKNSSVVV